MLDNTFEAMPGPLLAGVVGTLLFSVVVSLGVAAVSLRRSFPGHVECAVVFGALAAWALAAMATLVPVRATWWITGLSMVQLLAQAVASLALVLAALDYSGLRSRTGVDLRRPLMAITGAFVALVVTSPLHGLTWRAIQPVTWTPVATYDVVGGVGFYAVAAYGSALTAASGLIILWSALVREGVYTDQSVAIAVGILVPLSATGLVQGDVVSTRLPVTPATFWFAGLMIGYSFYRSDFFRLLPATSVVGQEQLVQDMRDGALVVDARGTVADANPAMGDLLGRDHDSLVGECVETVVPADLPSEGEAEIQVETERGPRTFEVTASPLTAPGGTDVGTMLVFRDVTERERRSQQLMVLNRLLRHNLRNDLNVVMGAVRQVHDVRADGGEDDSLIDQAVARCRRLESLGEKAQTVERLFEHHETERQDLARVLEKAIAPVDDRYEWVAVDVSLPDGVVVDAVKDLDTAIQEVVENACKHNVGDRQAVSVRVTATADRATVVVEDDGPGIPDHELSVIERGEETDLHHSSGVGLWLTRWIVDLSGGEFRADVGDDGTSVAIELRRATDSSATGRSAVGADD